MERREFLRKAGVGTLALGSLPLLADVAAADDGDGSRRFYFQALSRTPSDVIVMSGAGGFRGSEVKGGGEFVRFNAAQLAAPSSAFIATGGWRAVELVSWNELGTWGRGVAGILTVRARLKPCEGRTIRGATLEIVCNIGPAGLVNPGKAEGYTLTLPDGTTFSPLAGLTFFTRRCEDGDDD